jgi:hypothetical protein
MKRLRLSALIGVTVVALSIPRSKTREKESAVKTQIRYAAYSLVGITIALTLLLAYPDVNRSRAKALLSTPLSLGVETGMADEETVTLKPSSADIKTWTRRNHAYPSNKTYWPCGTSSRGTGVEAPNVNEVFAGYDHFFDAGAKPLPCQERTNDIYRGAVWFDLSEIRSKLPGVSVTSASLHFRKVASVTRMTDGNPFPGTRYCANELLVASVDWRKGLPSGSLPAGSFFHSLSELPPKGGSFAGVKCDLGGGLGGLFFCSVEVGPAVNNWVTGKEDDFGFVIKGEDEAPTTEDNAACWTRYDNFELVVNYKYDATKKPDTPVGKTPPGPGGSLDIRKNVALASNDAKASASSTWRDKLYPPEKAIDGDHKGLNWGSGGGWHGAGPTNSDWLQIDFSGTKTIDEIDVFMVQDNYASPVEPDLSMTFTLSGLRGFEVQYINAFGFWTDVPDGEVSGNDKVWRQFKFPALKTKTIRVLVNKTPDGYSRIVEVEAWGH